MRHNGVVCLIVVRLSARCADSVHRHTLRRALRIGYTGALFKGE